MKENEQDFSGILNKMKNYLLEYYEPVQHPGKAEFHYTTTEIWQQLIKVFPNESILTPDMVAQWMHLGGFNFFDFGEMRLEWLMKSKHNGAE